MFKAMVMLSRRHDMSADEFRHWWLNDHAPLAAQLAGVRRVIFNEVADSSEVDGISELWFDSEADFHVAYAAPLGQSVASDSMAHVRSRTRFFVIEHPIVDVA